VFTGNILKTKNSNESGGMRMLQLMMQVLLN
jgi:hypothetical protein